ncbi:methyl-accepting chemotaxis protein [Aliagarivorans taiwanensis]|uniref:methyl-accepting chemotaxis protein n=1 Tax=Aliagarivorans taiwanensis TaxID=561966 RepID=UPI00047C3CBE|nr:methyl-accepting chemotaxis protein [Aliagarivorans taiwanensis]
MNPLTMIDKLLQQLNFKMKFVLVGLLIFIPLTWLSSLFFKELNSNIAFTDQEIVGTQYQPYMKQLFVNIAAHRGLTQGLLKGDQSLIGPIREKERLVEQAFQSLHQFDKQNNDIFELEPIINQLERQWRVLPGNTTMSSSENFNAHSALIVKVHNAITHIADKSNLTLDPELDTYYLMEVITKLLPSTVESIGKLRGMGTGTLAADQLSAEGKLRLSMLSDLIASNIDKLNYAFTTINRYNPELNSHKPSEQKMQQALQRFNSTTQQELLDSELGNISPSAFFDQGTQAIASVIALYDELQPELEHLLQVRRDNSFQLMLTIVIGMSMTLIISCLMFVSMYRSITGSINTLSQATKRIAAGDLTVHCETRGKDELNQIFTAINQLTQDLSTMTHEIIQTSVKLGGISVQLLEDNQSSSASSEQQCQEITQVAASMSEMSVSVSEVANNTGSATQSAEQALESSESGKQQIKQLSEAIADLANEVDNADQVIKQLEADSSQINSIVEAISGIAEQTNLLALNAAIEAARAGEQGRGFAVVADEVRALAKRTQDSTLEIQSMLGKIQSGSQTAATVMKSSAELANRSVQMSATTDEAFDATVSGINTIHEMNIQIASATEQQSAVSNEISANVTRIQESAELTKDIAERSLDTSQQVQQASSDIQQQLARFTLQEKSNAASDSSGQRREPQDELSRDIAAIPRSV